VKDVIRHAGIGAGDVIEDILERDFGFHIAVLAGFNEPFRFVRGRRQRGHVLRSGVGSKKSRDMAPILSLRASYRAPTLTQMKSNSVNGPWWEGN